MSSETTVLPLEDCLDALIDYRGKTPVKTDSGIPLITAKIIKGGRIETPTEFIAKDEYVAWMRRGIPKEGDVVLTVEAPLGEVAQLGPERIALAQRVVTLRGKAKLLDSTYLLYLLQTEEMQEQLKSRATGTTVLGIKQSELRKVTLTLPSFDLQLSAAATLKALDDRITLLRETNATLEAIAQALFKSWFVDFDPVRAKQEGRAPEGMDEATARLFPDSFEESELGLVPRGWKTVVLAELTTKIGSGATPRGGKDVYLDDGVALIRSQNVYDSEFVWGGLARISNDAADQLKSVEVRPSDVLLNITGASILRTCVVTPDVLPARVNQHVSIIRAKESIPSRYIHLHLLQRKTKEFLLGLNAGGSREAVTKVHIESVPIIRPSDAVLAAFKEISNPIYQRNEACSRQERTLATLRDTLLPRLISGQLRLPEAQAAFDAALA